MFTDILNILGLSELTKKLNKKPLTLQQNYEFFKFLNSFLSLGYSIEDSIHYIIEALPPQEKKLLNMLNELKLYISKGQTLSDFIQKTNYLNKSYIPLIITGEKTGTLAYTKNSINNGKQSVLDRIIEDLKEKIDLLKQVKSAMTYPVIVVVAVIGLLLALTYKILPQIMTTMLEMAGGDITKFPSATRYMYNYVTFMHTNGTFVFLVIGIIIGSIIYLFKSGKIYEYLKDNFFKIPLLGIIMKYKFYLSFFSNLLTFHSVGYDMVSAFKFLQTQEHNPFLKKFYRDAIFKLEQGANMHSILDQKLFEDIIRTLIKQSEKGNLGDQLVYLVEYYKDRLLQFFAKLQSLLQPILLIVVGGSMGFVMVSLIKGIYGFMSMIGQ
jgi:type IV pilus assembly protein PilC